ncbi:MAG: hypothetical protein QXL15_04355, partial [Candidatus Korarchaeota archaeon]
IEETVAPECVIYSGGGSMLALIPPTLKDTIMAQIKEGFKNLGIGGELRISYVEDDAPNLKDFGKCIEDLFNSAKNTITIIPSMWDIDPSDLCPSCYIFPKGNNMDECSICSNIEKVRDVLYKPQPANQSIIGTITTRDILNTTTREIMNKILQDADRNSLASFRESIDKMWEFPSPPSGETRPEVAFIKGDGDNFGSIKQDLAHSPTLYRQVSRLFKKLIEDGLTHALQPAYNSQRRPIFRIVFAGGDDFLIIVERWMTIGVLKKLWEFIRNETTSLDEIKKKYCIKRYIGFSTATVVAHSNIPFSIVLETLDKMLEDAKSYSRQYQHQHQQYQHQHQHQQPSATGGGITINIQRFTGLPYIKETYPLSGEELFNNVINKVIGALIDNGKLTIDSRMLYRVRENAISDNADSNLERLLLEIAYRWGRVRKNRPAEASGWKVLYDYTRGIQFYDLVLMLLELVNNDIKYLGGDL